MNEDFDALAELASLFSEDKPLSKMTIIELEELIQENKNRINQNQLKSKLNFFDSEIKSVCDELSVSKELLEISSDFDVAVLFDEEVEEIKKKRPDEAIIYFPYSINIASGKNSANRFNSMSELKSELSRQIRNYLIEEIRMLEEENEKAQKFLIKKKVA